MIFGHNFDKMNMENGIAGMMRRIFLMANKYAGTQTEKNLEAAFAGESMARSKYTYYASKAKKEGYEQIAAPMRCMLFRS